ncbi:MAG: hypothetical protein GXX91_05050 [Verrucomicrobiaceae bacterium]|nr:hypothetical protein [Verrucomicrobiaceae bacterium]
MKNWFITCLTGGVLALSCALAAAAPPEKAVGESALGALDGFLADAPLEPGAEVLGMVGFFGQPEPVQWLILTSHPETPEQLRESIYARGRLLAERKFRPLSGQDLPHLPLKRAVLKIDSEAAFRAVEELAHRQKRAFDSAHFQLRVRDLGSEPVWMLHLLNRAQVSIGVVYLSATTGEILRETWKSPAPAADPGGTKISSR